MKDLESIKFENAKRVAAADGYRVVASYAVLSDDYDAMSPFDTEAAAWEAAARQTEARRKAEEEKRKAEAAYLDRPPVEEVEASSLQCSPLRTYNVIGRYFDNGYVFHDAVAADSPHDAAYKVLDQRNVSERDWEVIAVLQGERIEDVTPLEFI